MVYILLKCNKLGEVRFLLESRNFAARKEKVEKEEEKERAAEQARKDKEEAALKASEPKSTETDAQSEISKFSSQKPLS